MPSASWRGQVIAESARFETVEGNIYFPPDSLKREFFKDSATTSVCPWKGLAHYYNDRGGRRREPRRGLVLSGSEVGRREHP
ncbi:MAG: DUF427 domain-containing protein [Aliidongia sp.]